MDYGLTTQEDEIVYAEAENSMRHGHSSNHQVMNGQEDFLSHRSDLMLPRDNGEDLEGIDLYNDVEQKPNYNQPSSIPPLKPGIESQNTVSLHKDFNHQSHPTTREDINNANAEDALNIPASKENVHKTSSEGGSSEGTMLFIGELQWWTTDAELESALSEYGRIKEVKFFEEKASGKSKGYCQVEFVDSSAAKACKENMSGKIFNGRSCVVAYASPATIKHLIASQQNAQLQSNRKDQSAGMRGKAAMDSGMPFGMAGPMGGRGPQQGAAMFMKQGAGLGGRGSLPGPMGGPMMGGRGMEGNARGNVAGGRGMGRGRGPGNMGVGLPFGPQGGPPMAGPMGMPGMMPGGFDPSFGPMGGRGFGLGPGGFPRGPYPGMGPGMGGFPGMGPGLPGVAPHLNPAFFGRGGMGPAGGMGEGQGGSWEGAGHGGSWNEEMRGDKDFDNGDGRMRGGKGKRGGEGDGSREEDWDKNRGLGKGQGNDEDQWGNSNAEDDFTGKRRRER